MTPFLSWRGGKTSSLPYIIENLPPICNTPFYFVDGFVGGGSVSLWVLAYLQECRQVFANDKNSRLINVYECLKNNADEVYMKVKLMQNKFLSYDFHDKDNRKAYYLNKRNLLNMGNLDKVELASIFIFLNKTCFNGQYRENNKGDFNVSIGDYGKGSCHDILNYYEAKTANKLFKKAVFSTGDFEQIIKLIPNDLPILFYFDPPYIIGSEHNYVQGGFNSDDLDRLKEFCFDLTINGHYVMVSHDNENTWKNIGFKTKPIEIARGFSRYKDSRVEILATNYS